MCTHDSISRLRTRGGCAQGSSSNDAIRHCNKRKAAAIYGCASVQYVRIQTEPVELSKLQIVYSVRDDPTIAGNCIMRHWLECQPDQGNRSTTEAAMQVVVKLHLCTW